MNKVFAVGQFDLDIALRDAGVDEMNRATRRSLANASIGVEAFDAYHSARELFETLEALHEGERGAKRKLTQVLSCGCDDYQRCLYYTLAGRGVLQMLDDLEWLLDLLKARCEISNSLEAAVRLPPVLVRARLISSSSMIRVLFLMLKSPFDSAIRIGSWASRSRGGKSSTPICSPSAKTTARSMVFSSSRTFPGQW